MHQVDPLQLRGDLIVGGYVGDGVGTEVKTGAE